MNWKRKAAKSIGAGSWLWLEGLGEVKITGIEYPRDGTITFTLKEPDWWATDGLHPVDLKITFRENQRPWTAREGE